MSGTTKQEAAQAPLSRDALRAKIFGAKPESTTIEFFGGQVELRQPKLEALMEMRRSNQEDALTQMLINYAYVPGSDEHVFEDTDEESIKQIPFGADMQRLTQAVNLLVGLTAEGLEKQVGSAVKSPAEGSAEGDGNGGSL
jgi:hypothetical protein